MSREERVKHEMRWEGSDSWSDEAWCL